MEQIGKPPCSSPRRSPARRLKPSPNTAGAARLAAANARANATAAQPGKGLRTGNKRPRELLLSSAPPARDAKRVNDKQLTDAALMPPPPAPIPPIPPSPATMLPDVDRSGLDLLLRASEARAWIATRPAPAVRLTPRRAAQATPLKSPFVGRGRVPGASPLGQLAHLVATSPFLPHGWQAAGKLAAPKAVRRLGKSTHAPRVIAALGVTADGPLMQAAAATVVGLAPDVAIAAAARWLDLLVADIRARHAALRKSRGRLSRAHTALSDGRSSADAAAVAVLMRQLDGALAGEEAMLVARMQQVADMRSLCGISDGSSPVPTFTATPAQAAASAAALIITAGALASGHDGSRAAGSSGSDGD